MNLTLDGSVAAAEAARRFELQRKRDQARYAFEQYGDHNSEIALAQTQAALDRFDRTKPCPFCNGCSEHPLVDCSNCEDGRVPA